jgi:hypothetical protein
MTTRARTNWVLGGAAAKGADLLSNINLDDCGLTTKAASGSPSNLPLNPCRLAGLRNIAALPATP